jgi:hypothetical protein
VAGLQLLEFLDADEQIRSRVAARVLLDQSMEAGEKPEGGYESGKDGLNMVVVIPS